MNNLTRILLVSTVASLGISPAAAQGLGGGASAQVGAGGGGGGASFGLETAAEASGGASEHRGSSGKGDAPLQTPANAGAAEKYGVSTEVLANIQTRVGAQAGQVIDLILQSRWSENSLQDVEAETLQAYDASAVVGAEAQADLEIALSARAGDIARLRKAISTNAAISAWLQTRGIAPEAVVAVGKTANGSLAIFSR